MPNVFLRALLFGPHGANRPDDFATGPAPGAAQRHDARRFHRRARQSARAGLSGCLAGLAGARRRAVSVRRASGKTHLARIWAARAGAALAEARAVCASPSWAPRWWRIATASAASEHEPALFAMLERGTPLLLTGRARARRMAGRAARSGLALSAPWWRSNWASADEALLMALAVKLFADRQLHGAGSGGDRTGAATGTVARPRSGISSPGPTPDGAEPPESP